MILSFFNKQAMFHFVGKFMFEEARSSQIGVPILA